MEGGHRQICGSYAWSHKLGPGPEGSVWVGRQWVLGDELYKILSDRESRILEHDSGSNMEVKWIEAGDREANQEAIWRS